MKKPVLLMILDGFGHREETFGNAVAQANTKNFDDLMNKYPNTLLHADSEHVGLPSGQMGNSEVGHLNIGAGRVVYQTLELINKSIREETIYDNSVLKESMKNAEKNGLHLWGLLSDGGVHAHINHLFALLKMAKKNNVSDVYIHVVTDGRDVDPKSAVSYIKMLQEKIEEVGVGVIATISGRYYAMDRDKRWERVEKAYKAIVLAQSENTFTDPIKYIEESYNSNIVDEFLLPAVNSNVHQKIADDQSLICYNYRPDRASQFTGILTNKDYNPNPSNPVYKPDYRPSNLSIVQFTKYANEVKANIAFVPEPIINSLGEVLADAGKTQIRIAETEKYPHVTFFFDGGVEKELNGAKRILVDSPKVATYDLKPEMSAYELTDELLKVLDEKNTDVVILNYANPDMVGHSGNLDATMKACEAVDECLKKVVDKVMNLGGACLITADHGNADKVLNEDGSPNTAHTTSLVPFILVCDNVDVVDGGALCDLAPTILDLASVKQPKEMTGTSLIKR